MDASVAFSASRETPIEGNAYLILCLEMVVISCSPAVLIMLCLVFCRVLLMVLLMVWSNGPFMRTPGL